MENSSLAKKNGYAAARNLPFTVVRCRAIGGKIAARCAVRVAVVSEQDVTKVDGQRQMAIVETRIVTLDQIGMPDAGQDRGTVGVRRPSLTRITEALVLAKPTAG